VLGHAAAGRCEVEHEGVKDRVSDLVTCFTTIHGV